MARIRTIKPEFFRNRRLFLAERESQLPLRLGFAGLWTCADREGRFRWEPEELKLDALPYDPVDFAAVMDALEGIDAIRSYTVDGKRYGFIPAWKLHQVINNRESPSILPEPPDVTGTRAPRVVDASPTRHDLAQGEGKGKEGKHASLTRGVLAKAYPADFEALWAAYPRREGGNSKADALKQWTARRQQGVTAEEMLEGTRRYAAYLRATQGEGTRYVKQAATFLGSGEHWREPWMAPSSAAGAPKVEAMGNVL